MSELIHQRIKQVREILELSQRNFSMILSLSHSYIAGIETGTLKVNGRLIKLIVSEFGVNEVWLTTGKGEMFMQNPDEKFTKLVTLFKILPPMYQDVIYQIIEVLLKSETQTK
ncbi:MAG: helix-turn-helix domain-containing protein [Treponema sp.]|jgi:transcriptional regulator with XRE-family HTH domain|nr:helix-turn-helix domain-containing protein [Treponema sp.]